MDDFLLRALAGGIGVAIVAGPLGAFVVWRRLAYFGDTLSHSALLGIAIGLAAGIEPELTTISVCAGLAVVLVALQHQRYLAGDTLLGILSHSALSLGLVVVAFMPTLRLDLMTLLFGDILAVTASDLYWIWGGGAVSLALLALLWRKLLAITVHEELARVEGVNATLVRLGFMLLIALVIAVALKIVGILLITSLLIVPAAAARRLAATPEAMAILAALVGSLSVAMGLAFSFAWDTPTGPSIVVAAATLFAAGLLVPLRRSI
ncbi:MAG: hypothetical protein EXQ97_04585 [Alphaproteobacteria bacterium]|nr:hypothetical protein [Alphaproteobacteria bacterium]